MIRNSLIAAAAGLAVLGLAPLAATPALAAPKPAVSIERDGFAIQGHDPVAYFTQGAPVSGRADLTATYRGATFRFATPQNRTAFLADPARYAPQYGGYCAWAAAQGYTAPGRADHWRIVNGKLYLNYDRGVPRRWERDIPGFIAKADANWPRILDK